MNKFQRKNPRISAKNELPSYAFRSRRSTGPYRASKIKDYKPFPVISYNNASADLYLTIISRHLIAGSVRNKLRKAHIYRAIKTINICY